MKIPKLRPSDLESLVGRKGGVDDFGTEPDDGDPGDTGDLFTSISLEDLPDDARALAEQRLKQMQSDYTSKTTDISKTRKALDAEKQQMELDRERLNVVRKIDELAETNPQAAAQMLLTMASYFDPTVSGKNAAVNTDPVNKLGSLDLSYESEATQALVELMSKVVMPMLSQVGSQVKGVNEYVMTAKQEREMGEIRKEFGDDIDADAIMAESKKLPGVPLKLIAAGLSYAKLQSKVADNNSTEARAREDEKEAANIVAGSSAGTRPVEKQPSTLREAWIQGKQELKGKGVRL